MGAVSTRPRYADIADHRYVGGEILQHLPVGSHLRHAAPSISLRSISSAIQRSSCSANISCASVNCTVNAEKREGCRRNRPLSDEFVLKIRDFAFQLGNLCRQFLEGVLVLEAQPTSYGSG